MIKDGEATLFSVCKLKIWDISGLLKVCDILYKCGKDMALKYDLHHWDNPRIKNWVIVILCALKNNIYLVCDGKKPVATFQTRKVNQSYLFMKLATLPEFAGNGIGTFCLDEIEMLGKSLGCREVICEVYDKSSHAITFYEHKGYMVYGETDTLKYKELKLRKEL